MTSAATLVADYSVGKTSEAVAVVRRLCPARDQRANEVLAGLLRLQPAPERAMDLSIVLGGVMAKCSDHRVDAWFRARLGESTGLYPAMHLVAGLLSNPTEDNVAAVRAFVFSPTQGHDVRTLVLSTMIEKQQLSLRQRVDLLVQVYEQSGVIPEPYRSLENGRLRKSTEAGYWRTRLLQSLTKAPHHPDAVLVLQSLGSDVLFESGGRDTVWRKTFEDALSQLEVDAESTPELRAGIRKTRELLTQQPK